MSNKYSNNMTPETFSEMEASLSEALKKGNLFETIVNLPFKNKILTTSIDLGIMVLLQIDPKTKTIDRVALSDTEQAKSAVKVSAKQFHEIKIPMSEKSNIIATAIRQKEYKLTEDWAPMFNPVLTPKQARLNQENAGIECSLVYPLLSCHGGALIFSFYQPQSYITDEHLEFIANYADLVEKALDKYFKGIS